ncbi:MAG: hypothetical protein R6V73_07130 [Anaerolineales bacterium]|jgi:hypothetical protein
MVKQILWFGALLAGSFFLSSCQTLFNFSPDRAAVEELITNSPVSLEIHPETIRVLQLLESEQGIMVLTTYLATNESNQINECLSLYKTAKVSQGWTAYGQGLSCWPAALIDQEPIRVTMGQNSTGESSSSDVSGLVFDPQIMSIEVIWDDGTIQDLEIVKGSYLAVRSGQYSVQFVHAFDEAGELVYSYEETKPAPGKENP